MSHKIIDPETSSLSKSANQSAKICVKIVLLGSLLQRVNDDEQGGDFAIGPTKIFKSR